MCSERRVDMARIARKCTKCDSVDARQTWSTTAEASDAGALERWTCPACAWPEAELVEADQEAARA
jgi:hypothetical protein